MPAEDRRQAILAAVIPLLLERGGEVSTREIAEAAGVAEGTIFRVFEDKRRLMLAAAEEAINPVDAQVALDEAISGVRELRDKVVIVAGGVLERSRVTMGVLAAVHPHLMASRLEHEGRLAGQADEGSRAGQGSRESATAFTPPRFVLKAQADLHRRLTGLFEPHRDQLATEPEVAAVALRSLLFGASRPELGLPAVLDPEDIADLLLNGVLRREN